MIAFRPLTEADAGWMAAMSADPDVVRYGEVVAENAASAAIMRKLGFERTRVGEWHGMEDHRYELRCA